ncbi:MAG: transcription termination/antitermination protein NusG [Acidimicrobiia bacterium]|nr:transcription termination/antitermination protein NusG [Acidimicrobiia bacterium]
MEDQAVGATEAPAEDAAENTESVEAVPAGVDPDAADAPVAEDGDPGGLLAAAFASVGLTSSDKLDEVLSKEEQEAADAAAAEAAEAADEAEADQADEAPAEAAEDAPEEPAAESDAEEADEEEEEEPEEPVDTGPASPYDLPGDWFVIHSYSGYENKVKANLETRIHSMHMEGEIFDVHIPMEDVVEIKGGRKVTVPKKVFPGYILVRMYLSDDSWFAVRNTPGVTGFVGSGTKPVPLSRREVERILGVKKEEAVGKAAPRFQPAWGVGETVRVTDGPFADFNGVIEEINLDQSKVRVLVNIFGRETPVELNFEQIVKL